MKEFTKEIVFRISEPMKLSEVKNAHNQSIDTNALLVNKDELVFAAFTIDCESLIDNDDHRVIDDGVYIISCRPLRDIDKDITMYIREKSIIPGQYEEKWRELNSEDLILIKSFMEDMREVLEGSKDINLDYGYIVFDYYSYYKSLFRDDKLNELGI